jgi:hypothetical protein
MSDSWESHQISGLAAKNESPCRVPRLRAAPTWGNFGFSQRLLIRHLTTRPDNAIVAGSIPALGPSLWPPPLLMHPQLPP